VSACRSCGAPIVWAKTTHGKSIPLDQDPSEEGTIVLLEGVAHIFRKRPDQVTLLRMGAPADTPFYTTHFATCPQGKDWRGRGLG
jgi:hypothetical protein